MIVEQTIPAGPIRDKYLLFATTEDFMEVGYIGAANTAKSDGLCYSINQSAIDYPGATLFLCRGTLQDLKNTTLDKLLTKYRDLDIHENKQRSIVYWPRDERTGHQSKVVCFGVNTGDYVSKMKSFEPFRVFMDEANECVGDVNPGDKLDFSLMRARQIVRHRHSYRERIVQLVHQGVLEREQDGLGHFMIQEAQLDDHQIGNPFLKYCANDMGNDWMWQRLVNFYGDKPHPPKDPEYWLRTYGVSPQQGMERWVHENVGITEVVVPASEVQAALLYPGVVIVHPDGSNDLVREVYQDHVLTVLNQKATIGTFQVVLERLAIYGFMLENHSANERNLLAHYLVSPEMRGQYMHGLIDIKSGIMHPQFSIETHVIPDAPIPSHWGVQVVLDYNVRCPTAIFVAENTMGDGVVFDTYEGEALGAYQNGLELLSRLKYHGIDLSRVSFLGDPAMWNRDAADPSKSVASEYQRAGIDPLYPANNDRALGVDRLQALLNVELRQVSRGQWANAPKLWFMERCHAAIYGSEHSTGLNAFTWEQWRLKKDDHLHDTLRYWAASRNEMAEPAERRKRPKSSAPRWRRPHGRTSRASGR